MEVRGLPSVRLHKAYPYLKLHLGDMYWETDVLEVDGSGSVILGRSRALTSVRAQQLKAASMLSVEIWHAATTTKDHMICQFASTLHDLFNDATGGTPPSTSILQAKEKVSTVMLSGGAGPLIFRVAVTPTSHTASPLDEVMQAVTGEFGVNGVVINQRGFAAVITGTKDAENAAVFSTYRLSMHHIPEAFGDQWNSWNRTYAAAITIFGDGLKSTTVRSGIHKQHHYLYAKKGGAVSKVVVNSGHALLRLLNYGVRGGCRRYFTYVLLNDEMRFSETGAATMKDFFSKHAMHCNALRTLRYAGEFCFQQSPRTGAWRLCIDNNSGTYGPSLDHLPALQRAMQANFPDLPVEVFGYSDPRLPLYKQSCDKPLPIRSLDELLAFAGVHEHAWTDLATDNRLLGFLGGLPASAPPPLTGRLVISVEQGRNIGFFDRPSRPYVVVGVTGLAGADNFLHWDRSQYDGANTDTRDPVFRFVTSIPMKPLGFAVLSGQRELVVRIMHARPPTALINVADTFLGEASLSLSHILQMYSSSSSESSSSQSVPLSPRFGAQRSSDFVSGSISLRVSYVNDATPSPASPILSAMKWCVRLNAWRPRVFTVIDSILRYHNPERTDRVRAVAGIGDLRGRFFFSNDARDPEPFRLALVFQNESKTVSLQLAISSLQHVYAWVDALHIAWASDLLSCTSGMLADVVDIPYSGEVQAIDQLGGALQMRSSGEHVRTHSFESSSFPIPTTCNFCGDKIWGIIRQGLRCSGCQSTFHQDCGVFADQLPCTLRHS